MGLDERIGEIEGPAHTVQGGPALIAGVQDAAADNFGRDGKALLEADLLPIRLLQDLPAR